MRDLMSPPLRSGYCPASYAPLSNTLIKSQSQSIGVLKLRSDLIHAGYEFVGDQIHVRRRLNFPGIAF